MLPRRSRLYRAAGTLLKRPLLTVDRARPQKHRRHGLNSDCRRLRERYRGSMFLRREALPPVAGSKNRSAWHELRRERGTLNRRLLLPGPRVPFVPRGEACSRSKAYLPLPRKQWPTRGSSSWLLNERFKSEAVRDYGEPARWSIGANLYPSLRVAVFLDPSACQKVQDCRVDDSCTTASGSGIYGVHRMVRALRTRYLRVKRFLLFTPLPGGRPQKAPASRLCASSFWLLAPSFSWGCGDVFSGGKLRLWLPNERNQRIRRRK
jgi:hypothetical protein